MWFTEREGVGMGYQNITMGGKIYSLRVAKGMTQEQLAAELCVSPAAVSKWERNLANPNVEMLVALADFFECTIDELVGREMKRMERVGIYDNEKLRLVETGEELLKCCEISRKEGLLALEDEMKRYQGSSSFLPFGIHFFLQCFMKRMDFEFTFELLDNYAETLPEEERGEGRMIARVLRRMASGENPEVIKEVIASYVGIGYWEKLEDMNMAAGNKRTREEIIEKYRNKKQYSERTNLLECFKEVGDFEIQVILRNLDNETLTAALCGASGLIVTGFLANLSDRLLYFVSEDIDNFSGTEEEILRAQRRVLAIGGCFLQE